MVKVYLKASSIWIYPYEKWSCPGIEKQLSIYDKVAGRYVNFLYEFDKEEERFENAINMNSGKIYKRKIETGVLKLPRGYGLDNVKEALFTANIEYKILDQTDMYPLARQVRYNMVKSPRSEHQVKTINFLNTLKGTQAFITLDVGVGKTYCVVNFLQGRKEAALIISYNLSEQWYERISEYTDCKGGKDVVMIVGSKYLNDVLNKNIKPNAAFYIVSLKTLESFTKLYGKESLQKVVDELGIGVKVFDEAHTRFLQFNMLDLNISCSLTLYLTATPGRSDHNNEKKMYRRIYAEVPSYGGHTSVLNNHYIIRNITYDSGTTISDRSSFKTMRGLSSLKYSRYLFDNHQDGLLHMIKQIMDEHFKVDKTKKGLIILDWLKDIETARDYYIEKYKGTGITVGTHCMLVKDKDERQKELDKNIIFGTLGSMQNGKDIKDLQFIICLVQYSSDIVARQLLGRLRPLKGADVYYYNMIDSSVPDIKRQARLKDSVFRNKAKNIEYYEMSLYVFGNSKEEKNVEVA